MTFSTFKKQFGIDISHHNGKINWAAVSLNTPKIDFVYQKATEGVGYVDPTAMFNAVECKKNGLKISYYHFATLDTHNEIDDAKREAAHFIDTLKTLPGPDFHLALDIETNKVQLSPDEVLVWIKTFFTEMKDAGYNDMLLYSNYWFLKACLPADHGLTNNLWLSGYVPENRLKIPEGWDTWTIWQYNNRGRINGIATDVDLNRMG